MSQYKQLNLQAVIATIETLQHRVAERFPESGLHGVCNELLSVAVGSQKTVERLASPLLEVRIGVGIIIFLGLMGVVYSFSIVDFTMSKLSLTDLIQVFESLINDILLVGASLYFLLSVETKIKRARALSALHELRSLAHVVDMHQLTKDPSALAGKTTQSSPKRTMDAYDLQRYLDYCSEMLSLVGKVAALYSQKLPDHEIVGAASQIEDLCTGLSRKIWQKLVVLAGEGESSP